MGEALILADRLQNALLDIQLYFSDRFRTCHLYNVWNFLNESCFILFINVLVMIIIEIIMLDYSFF